MLGSSSSGMVQAAVSGPRVLGPEVETENRDKRNVTKLIYLGGENRSRKLSPIH